MIRAATPEGDSALPASATSKPARRLPGLRPLVAAIVAAAALASPAWTGTAFAGAGAHTQLAANLVVTAPGHAAVGRPITVRLAVHSAKGVGGYETSLLFDHRAAHFSGIAQAHDGIARSGRGVAPLGPVEAHGAESFGLYSCPVADCATGRGRRHPAGVSGRVALVAVTVVPDRAGVLELRFARTVVVDARGRTVVLSPSTVVRVHVGAATNVFRAPRAAWRAARFPRMSQTLRSVDRVADGAITNADAQSVVYRWTMRRYGGGPCLYTRSADDINRDGCVDVGDVQAVTAAYTKPVRRIASPRVATPPLLDPVGAPSFGISPPLTALLLPANVTFTVDSIADDPDANTADGICRTAAGACTLRAAIESANAHTGADGIAFAIPGTGIHTIALASALPSITDTTGGVEIDGYTQPGASPNTDPIADNAVLRIAITGGGDAVEYQAFHIISPNNTIRGLAIYSVWRKIWMSGGTAHGNLVAGNFIGTDPTATYVSQNFVASEDGGLLIDGTAHDNRVGEETAAGRNVISGNQRSGLHIIGEGTTRNIVRNTIAGLSPDGTRRLGNLTHGFDVDQGADHNIIGGTGPFQRNVMSGNHTDGIEITHHTTTTGNQVVGNYIGTDLTGNVSAAYTVNDDHGIHIDDGVNGTIITDNVVGNAGTRGGIVVEGALTTGNVIARNRVGISLNGTAIPNVGPGIAVHFHAVNTTIGPGNVVTNEVNGIEIGPEADVDRNKITQNSIYGNSGLGIDVDPAGVNPNGYYPATGPNQALPFPVLATATAASVTGRACTSCTVEIFAADGGANAFGQGKTFVGSAVASASGTFTATIAGVAAGDFVTATATDSNGNSSEFSLNRAVTASGDAAAGTLIARDQFSRTLTGSWGSATLGGPWTVPTPLTDWSVANGAGTVVLPAANTIRGALLSSLAQRDVDVTVEVATDKVATGGNHWVYVISRQNGTNEYRAVMRMAANGAVFLQFSRLVGNTDTAIGTELQVSGLVHTAGQGIWVRMQATGASPTTLRAKAWADGALEPTAWTTTQTNSEATLQGAGAIGLRSYVGSSVTNAPITVSYDELRASVPSPDDGIPPAAPQHLTATPGSDRVSLSWDQNSEADVVGYHVYRATTTPVPTTGTPLSGTGPVTATTYVDATAVNDATYHYVVIAADASARRSGPSNEAVATPNVAAGKGLDLNGTSQYVTFGAAPALNTTSFTLELWFKRTGTGVGTSTGTNGLANAIPLITKGRAEAETPANLNMDYFLGIDASSGTLVADFEDTVNGTNHPVSGVTPVTSNVWHHAAAVYDTLTDTWRLYLDGVLDRTLALGGDFTPEATSVQHAAIGSALTSTGTAAGFFQGTVDEARIWSIPRTTTEIQQGMTQQLLPTPGLLGRFGFEENGGTTIVDSVPGGPDGTAVGGPAWVAGAPFTGPVDNAPTTPSGFSASPEDEQVLLSWDANSEPDLAGYNIYRSTSLPVDTSGTPVNGANPVTVSNYLDISLVNNQEYFYAITAVDTQGHSSPPTAPLSVTPGESVGSSLALNGSSQYVTFGAAPALNASSFTLELWFRRSGAGVGTSTGTGGIANAIPLVTKGRAEVETPANLNMDYFLGIDASTGTLVADFEDTATAANHPVTGTTPVTSNVWHHAAAVYDTGTNTWRLYLDGILDRTLALGGAFTPESTSIQHAAIGSALTSNGTAAGFFQGDVDEVRIWNVPRTTAQIQATEDLEVTSGSGLIGRYGLNEGSGTTVGSTVATAPTGTIVGGAAWSGGAPLEFDFMPPAAPTGLSAAGGTGSITLNWAANIENDLAGYNVYRSTTTPVPTTGTPLNGATKLTTRTYTDTNATPGTTYHYVVTAVDFSNNQSLASADASAQASGSGTNQALQLNGTSQYVTFGPAPALNASNFTIELWFQRTGAGAGTSTGTGGIANAIPLVTKGRAEAETPANLNMDYFLGIDASTGVLVADFEDSANGTNHPVSGTTAVSSNVWHHAAAVYDTATHTWSLYLDGVLDRTLALGGAFTPESTSIQHAAIGSALTSNGTAAGFFQGTVDEVRIWNVARSSAQIAAGKDQALTTGTGLIGRYGLNEGSGSTAGSSVAGGPAGSLVGNPAWTAGAPLGGGGSGTNAPPTVALNAPADAATGTATAVALSATGSDPDSASLTVTFFGRVAQSGLFTQIASYTGVAAGATQSTVWSARDTGLRYEWYATVNDGATTATSPVRTFNTASGADPVLVGVGDIADCASSGDEATGALIAGIQGGVYTLGDNVYLDGTAAQFANCYDPTWGGATKLRTRPTPGNHDWNTGNLNGYFGYYGANAGGGPTTPWYSYDVGSFWHVIVLDSDCALVSGGCGAGSPQVQFLTNDLALHAGRNVIAMWHHPRFSSGTTNLTDVQPFVDALYAAHADLVLVGHDHIYERFTQLGPSGAADPNGPRYITAGMGGESHHTVGTIKPTSQAHDVATFGVLRLVLHPTSYDFKFFPVAGFSFTDSGSTSIAGANSPPSATVAITPGSAGTGDVLTATATKQDPDADPVSLTWEWRVNGTLRRTFTSASALSDTFDLSQAGNGDAGDTIAVSVTPSDATHTGTAATSSLTVSATNHAPVFSTDLQDLTLAEGAAVDLHPSATDADGNTLTYDASGLPAGIAIDHATGVISGTLSSTTAGTYDISVTVSDGTLGDLDTFRLTVTDTNHAPVFSTDLQDRSDPEGAVASLTAQATDGDNDTLTFSATGLPAGVSIDPSTGVISGTIATGAAGLHSVTITVSDGSATATDTFSWTVTGADTPPAAPAGLVAAPANGAVGLSWTANGEADLAGYRVYRATSLPVSTAGNGIAGASLLSSPAYIDSTAVNGTTYDYVVVAVDAAAQASPASAAVTATPSAGSASSLVLNGSSQYVTMGAAPGLDAATFTLELWFKRTGTGVGTSTGTGGDLNAIPLLTKGRAEAEGSNVDMNYFLGIDAATNKLVVDFEGNASDSPPGLNHPLIANTVVTSNVWHHAAATYDGTSWRIYLDGAPDGTLSVGRTPRSDSIQHAAIGTAMNSTGVASGFFAGQVDEARIWNVARSDTQIAQNRFNELTSGTGLIGRFGLNEGSGVVAGNSVAGGVNGTVVGGPTWAAGFPSADLTPPAAPGGFTATAGSHLVALGWTANAESDLAGYRVYRATSTPVPTTGTPLSGAALLTSPSYTDSSAVNGTTYHYVVTAVDTSGNQSASSVDAFATPSVAAGSALQFNSATQQYVTFGAAPALGATTFTLETWFKRTGPGVGVTTGTGAITSAIPLVTKGGAEAETPANVNMNYFLGIDATSAVLVADFEEAGGANHPVAGTTAITSNVWHHAAAVYDATTGTWRLYLDGNLDKTLALGSAFQPESASIQHAALGTSLTSTGAIANTGGFFQGVMDEVRIWNIARTTTQIQADRDHFLTTGTGLIARYGLDEGTGTTIASSIAAAPNGTLTNTPTWTAGQTLTAGGNTPPVVDTATVTPAAPTTDQTLTANVTSHDADGDPLTTSYQWTRNTLDIPGATAGTLDLATLGNGDKGDQIAVRVTVNDGAANSAPVTSATVAVVDSAPLFTTDLQDRSSTVGTTANLNANATDADNDTLTYSATGLPTGTSIDPATGIISGTIGGSAAVNNVTITVSDGSLTATDTFTWTITPPANTPPVVDTVTVTPAAPTTNQTLTAQVTSHDADGDPLTTSYQWTRNTLDIPGATAGTLNLATLGNGDKGDQIAVRVTVNDGAANSAPVTSATVAVVDSAPLFTTDLQDRSSTVGTTANLNANATDADNDTLTYSATGLPTGTSIDPATGIISGTIGGSAAVNNVTITVSDGSLTATDTFTWTITPPANTPPVVDTATVSPTSPTTDQTLTANVTSHDADGDPLTTSYQWTRSGLDIAGATSSTLDLSQAGNGDHGDLIRVRATVNDGTVDSAAVTSSPVTVVDSAPVMTTDLQDRSDPEGAVASLTAQATDGDNDTLTFSATGLPAGVSIDPSTGVISGTIATGAAGLHSVTITVSDGSATAIDTFSWTVTGADTPPAAPAGLVAAPANGAVGLSWTANGEADLAGYRVYRATSLPVSTAGNGIAGASLLSSPAYIDSTAVNGTTYDYVVVAVDAAAQASPASAAVTATPSAGSASSLVLNGSSQYVTMGAAPGLDAATFTLELWFKRTGTGVGTSTGTGGDLNAIPLLTKGRAEAEGSNVDMNYFLGIDAATNKLVVDFEGNASDSPPGLNHPLIANTVVTSNVWHHAAATYDGTSWRIYLDGAPDGTLSVGRTPRSDSIQHAAIGTAMNSTGVASGFFAGQVDEARIWNVARSDTQIAQNRFNELTSGTGLIGRFGLNEGSGVVAGNSVAGGVNGTVVGGPTWAAGFPSADLTPPAAPGGFTATAGSHLVALGWTANAESDLAGYRVYRATSTPVPTTGTPLSGAALLTSPSYTDSSAVNGTTYHYVVTAVDTSGNQSASSVDAFATPSVAAGSALQFNSATQQYVTFGAAPALGATTFTLETWFKRTGPGVGVTTGTGAITSAIPLVTKGGAEAETPANVNMNYFLGIDATSAVLVADFEEAGGANHPVAGTTAITSNVWHHAAAVYDATTGTWRLYLDGNLDKTLALGSAFQPESASIQHAALGTSLTSTGAIANTGGFFQGVMDEVRIWNIARTTTQIQADRDHFLTTGTGLIARYGLDEGTGTTIASSIAAAPNGTLTNTPTWTAGQTLTAGGNTPPVVDTATVTPAAPTTNQTLTAQVTSHDADGDPLTTSYQWTRNTLDIPGATAGTLDLATLGNGDKGDQIAVRVTVNDGAANSAPVTSATVAVVDSAPLFTTDLQDRSSTVGTTANLNANATDADNDTLTYSATGLPTGTSIDPATGIISGTIGGSAAVNNVTITVSDGSLTATDTFTWTITPPANTPPVVDTVTVTPAAPTTNQTLTAQVTSHDADGDPLTTSYQWTRNTLDIPGATAGTLNLATLGNGDKGDQIAVRVTVNDGAANSAPVTSAAVAVVDSAPLFTTDLQDRSSTVGTTANLNANATDADNDTLTYSATGLPTGTSIDPATGIISGTIGGSAAVNNVTITVSDGSLTATDTFTWTITPPANTPPVVDTVTVTPAAPTTNQTLTAQVTSHDADGDPLTTSYQWTRNTLDIPGATAGTLNLATLGNGDKGDQIAVRVTVNDGAANSAPVTSAAVAVVDSAPLFTTDLQDRSSTVGTTANLNANATDADNDTLTYSATGLPTGTSIDPATGIISGTIGGSAAVNNVTITVSDGSLTATDTFTWTITPPANTPPVVDTATISPTSPTTNQTLTANVTSHDAENDPLTTSYQWTLNGTDIAGATNATLDLSAPGNGSRGDVIRVRVTVTDGGATSAPVTSDPVTVVDSAPHFTTNLQDRSDTVGDAANLGADATDADSDALTYSATGLPAGISIAPATGVISGTLAVGSAGAHNVTITVSDGTLTDTDTLTWTVASANTPPVVDSVSVAPASPTTDQTLTATVTSHDANGDPLTTAYQWTRNGTDIAGATGSTLDLGGANNGNRGDLIRVRATVNDGTATSPAVTSSPVTIANTAPSATVGLAPAAPDTNAIVTATATRSDADADAVSLHYVWKVNGTTRRTTDTTALTDTLDLSVAGNGDPGDTVSVEVTPNDGTVNGTLASAQVTVAAAAQTVYASDLFARNLLNNWGSALTGGLYTLQGTAADYDVNGTLGTIVLGAASTNRSAVLASVAQRDVELSFRFTTDKAATGGSQFVYGILRRINSTNEYRAIVRLAPGGGVFIQASNVVNGTETSIGTEVRVTGLVAAPNQFIRVRVQSSGANPTTIRMRAWADGTTEPTTWQYTATNSAAALQVAGALGLRAYLGSATTNAPILVTFDDLLATSIGGVNTPPVVDSVSVAPASPTTDQTLTATVTSHDANGDPLTTAYQWTRNGTDIVGATGSTLDLGGANNGNRGDLIRVRATVNDGTATSPAVTSSPVTIANTAPSATVGLAPAAPDTNAIVTATATRSDADADAVSLHYVWKVNGTTRRTTDTTALTDTLDLSVAGNGDSGDTVSVEVTPNDGTVNGTLASAQVTVAAAAQTVYASDLFARNLLNNWGSALTGGLYTLQGTAADYDVNGTLGTIVLGAASTNRSAVLASVAQRDVELSFRFTTDKAATGGSQFVYGILRRINSTNEYRAIVRLAPGGGVFIQASNVVNGTETSIGTEVRVTGLVAAPNQFIRVRVQSSGANPTTIRMRAWADGTTEPTTWQYTATNSAAALQVAGALGLRAYLGSATTNAPILVTFDDLLATNVTAP